jgi:hypothetical protein
MNGKASLQSGVRAPRTAAAATTPATATTYHFPPGGRLPIALADDDAKMLAPQPGTRTVMPEAVPSRRVGSRPATAAIGRLA